MTSALLQQALEALDKSTTIVATLHNIDAHEAAIEAIRAELARPESTEMTLMRACYEEQKKLAQQERKPAWHYSPTEPGLWISSASDRVRSLDEYDIQNLVKYSNSRRWYGPIPEDK